MERTLIILKPDALNRQLIGRIITRFEEKGLQIVGCKLMRISRELGDQHYGVHKGKPFYEGLLDYVTSGPVVVLALQGPEVIAIARKLMGATFASEAEPGTIRGDFGCATGTLNLIHGSDSAEAAETELKLFFTDEELLDYDLSDSRWLYAQEG